MNFVTSQVYIISSMIVYGCVCMCVYACVCACVYGRGGLSGFLLGMSEEYESE